MEFKIGNLAVSETIGAITLLAMTIVVFSVVYMNVLSDEGPSPNAYTTIIGKTEIGHPVFEFQRGEGVGLDSKVDFVIGNNTTYNPQYLVQDLIESNDYSSINWDIGKRLFCPFTAPGKEIKVNIYDSITNSLVWWGILQEGGNLQDLGAIWRFNETQGSTAYDSLNDNDGTLHGPDWNTSVKWEGDSSLFFNGMDYVEVDGSSYSLNYIENLNITAYFKFSDNPYFADFTYGIPFGYEPNIIRVHDDVYAIAFQNKSQIGQIATVKIFSDGSASSENIFNSRITFTQGQEKCYWPRLCHVSGEVYLVVYGQVDPTSKSSPKDTYIKTLKIFNNGTVKLLNGYKLDNQIFDYSIIKISDNHTALVCRTDTKSGMIKTINITDNGNTIPDYYSAYIFEENECYEPNIIHINNNIYAIVYGTDNDEYGIIKTVKITPDGIVHQPFIDSFIFEQNHGAKHPIIKLVSDNTYVITYSNNVEKIGILKTIRITDSGYIVKEAVDTLEFEKDMGFCIRPKIIHMSEDYFVISYEGQGNVGYFTITKIGDFGDIDHTFLLKNEINTSKGFEADILKITDNIFAIVLRTETPHPGELKTYSITDVIDSILGPTNCGIIYKKDTWSIYVNQNYIVATINNEPFKYEYDTYDLNIDEWNKLILTYNGSHLEVYCNENTVPIISEYYNFDIYGTNIGKVIRIGERFHGYIDEVSILDK